MTDVGVFPSLPGLGWTVTKTPTFQTRIQRATSGRELRALDYPNPLWQFTLVYDFLRDKNDARMTSQLGAGYDELRTLMGFYMLCQGAFGTFLFNDPTDNTVTAQILPAATSFAASLSISNPGVAYTVGHVVPVVGGTGVAATVMVTGVDINGAITGLSISDPGSYSIVPGITGIATNEGNGNSPYVNGFTFAPSGGTGVNYQVGDTVEAGGGVGTPASWTVTQVASNGAIQGMTSITGGVYTTITGPNEVPLLGGSGSNGFVNLTYSYGQGATVNLGWTTQTQLVRTLGGFVEPILAPNVVSAVQYDGVNQTGWSADPATGILTLPAPFFSAQPIIQSSFSYYFRCRFVDDSYQFENFMFQLWQLKKLTFISVLP